ncbi:hypothetical protein [Methanoregula sp.]|uniref:hypothetical protein n=1 Tax=Methanoregula sp. TaxID=2052170 RepID=UPI002607F080|nr:hypothetical protein [Methanoregula sp.]MDD5144245.1 hypothetical protein [Methanoregula sp.]
MTDAVITEHEGTRRGPVVRYYQYGNGGVRVLDAKKTVRRQYRFDPSSEIMMECDPARPDRTLRRFVFDKYGMVEEVFAFGTRPRTFRFENGAQRIAIREGGDYGAVGKLITFEDEGIAETVWGRNGEIERVLVFEPGNGVITERSGGWFGDVARTFLFDRIDASVFRGPDAFLQFLIFTEWSESDRNAHIEEQVAKIRSEKKGSPYAFTGKKPAPRGAVAPSSGRRPSRENDDGGIDFIGDADEPAEAAPRGLPARRGNHYAVEESRQQRERTVQGRYNEIRSNEIALQDRFERARSERGELSKGASVDIPLADRFEYARQAREPLSKGKSVEIPLDERFGGSSRHEREPLPRGASVDIPLEDRFESVKRDRKKPGRGESAEIPYEQRRRGRGGDL